MQVPQFTVSSLGSNIITQFRYHLSIHVRKTLTLRFALSYHPHASS